MSDVSYYTSEGLEKIKEDLNYLITKERANISKQLAEARDKGDLSENAEYDAAKDAQGLLELRISNLKNEIAKARLVDESVIDNSKVLILCKVKIKNLKTGAEMTYMLVTENEADLKKGKISVQSPIGSNLLGKKVGDIIEISIPAGKIDFEITEITR